MKTLHPKFIVGIGGSAGAFEVYKLLLSTLPTHTGMAFVIVSHISPTANSQLAQILSRCTKMPVTVASTGMPIQANHVYVIQPDADLLIESYTFKVISPRTARNAQIDLFLTSLAEECGASAIAIILSGYDGDGAEGCRQVKAKGGITFTQDNSAEVNVMPLSAQDSNCIDFVFPPDKISKELKKISSKSNK